MVGEFVTRKERAMRGCNPRRIRKDTDSPACFRGEAWGLLTVRNQGAK